MIFAVNNHDPDDSDFHRIRNSVEKVVETGDYRMRSPAHWMIYSLVIRQLQNRVESYDECFAIAKECGIRDTNEFNEALHFIHTKMGLIRYFPHEQLKDIVIVDPQILFEKVTELIVETFTFDKVCNHSKLEIFKNMGIFNLSDFIRISSQTGQNLTPPLFAKLLEYLRIAARFQQSGETKYFLPCALTHAQAKHSDYTSNIPSLIVTFQCGYCPKGLFGILITYLINNEMESEFEWELDTEKIYRDEVRFQVGHYDTVTVRFLTTHLEIKLIECDHEISRINCTVEGICQEIYQSVEKGIKTATSAINYINAQHSFTFYCTSESCSKDPHPAKLKKLKEKLCSLKCDKLNKVLPLPSGCEKWQLDSQPQISKGTVILPHSSSQHTLSEFGTRLKKQHLILLYGQLSGHASKWRDIGIYLKFLSNELDIIEAKPSLYHEGTKGFLREMISEWLEWAPGDQRGSEQYATLEALKIAVSSAGLGTSAADLTITVATTNSDPHPAKLMKLKGKVCNLKCDKLNKRFTLASGYEKWQLDSLPLRTASSLYSIKKCVTPHFLNELKDVLFDSVSLEHKVSGYDISIRMLEGSIPKGQTIHLKVGAALNGPFKSSSDKRPISPILWLCPKEDFVLSKPMEIVFPHILTDITSEDIKKFGIQVSKATHEDSSQNEYLFKPLESQDIKFESNKTENYAVIKVTHCCFWCLEANSQEQMSPEVAQQMAKKVGYTMHCIEHLQSPYQDLPSTKLIVFCVSFSLSKCLQVINIVIIASHNNNIITIIIIQAVKDQYPETNDRGIQVYRVHQSQYFKMNGPYVELKYHQVGVTVSRGGKVCLIIITIDIMYRCVN